MERPVRAIALSASALLSFALAFASKPPIDAHSPRTGDDDEVECEQVIEEQCPSHASGGRPELGPQRNDDPTDVTTFVRVGLRSTTFNPAGGVAVEMAGHDHPHALVTATLGEFRIIDLATGAVIGTPRAGQEVRVESVSGAYEVRIDGSVVANVAGPVRFRSTNPANTYRVPSIRRSLWTSLTTRAQGVPEYYGEIEVTRGSATPAGSVNVVNIVRLEDYVRGVVVNEAIASFHPEAIKAQAVAARGYALANKDSTMKFLGRPYGLDDSTSSQVYRGKGSEHPNGTAAVRATEGLVATHNGTIISALYSSSMGGHTEDNEWVFNTPPTQLPGTNPAPYLRGIYDGEGEAPDLSTDDGIAAFWETQQPETFDSCPRVNNRFARWTIEIPAATLKTRLAAPGRSTAVSGDLTGEITGLEIRERMAASRRIAIVRVHLTSGVADVRGWDMVRRVFGTTAAAMPMSCATPASVPTNFVLNSPSVIEQRLSDTGALTGIVAKGGGWGHNVGMSQFGAHGRGLGGQNFIEILKAYYRGVDIAAYPIAIELKPEDGPRQLRQTFASPSGRGTLRVLPVGGMRGLQVVINDRCELELSRADLAAGPIERDVSACLAPGTNVIEYEPKGSRGRATVFVVVE